MSKRLAEFIDGFVVPLLGAGDLHVGPPVRDSPRASARRP